MEEPNYIALPNKNIEFPFKLTRLAISSSFLAGTKEKGENTKTYLYNRTTHKWQVLNPGITPVTTRLVFNKSASLVHFGMNSGHIVTWNTQTLKESTIWNPAKVYVPFDILCCRPRFGFDFRDAKQPCTAIACNSKTENELFAGYANDYRVILWDVTTKQEKAIQKKEFWPRALYHNPSQELVAIISKDGSYHWSPNKLYLWDIRAKNCEQSNKDDWIGHIRSSFSWNPQNSTQFALVDSNGITLFDIRANNKKLASYNCPRLDWFTFLHNNNLLLKYSISQMFALYDITTQKTQFVGKPNANFSFDIYYSHETREIMVKSDFSDKNYTSYDISSIAPYPDPLHTEIMPLLEPLESEIKTYYFYYGNTLSSIKSLQAALQKYSETEYDLLQKDIINKHQKQLLENVTILANKINSLSDAKKLIALGNKATIQQELLNNFDECPICYEIYSDIYTKSAAGNCLHFACGHNVCSLCAKNLALCPLCRKEVVLKVVLD